MNNEELSARFDNLSTPLVADAALRTNITVHPAPPGIHPVLVGQRAAGHAGPVQHFGSVDVFLEAFEAAGDGDVVVIDNCGRTDEACIGDLTVLEAKSAGAQALVVWGTHRDTKELRDIAFPVFSYGVCAFGPQRLDPRTSDTFERAHFGGFDVTRQHVVFADDDGCIFAQDEDVEKLLTVAEQIWKAERAQAERIRAGETLRQQLRFSEFLGRRQASPSLTFRKYLREIGGAIEE